MQSHLFRCSHYLQNRSFGHPHLRTYGGHVHRVVVIILFSLKIEEVKGSIPLSYMAGGGIILAMFIAYLIFWGVLWCWGARQRDDLRRTVVERQLEIIRKEEYEQEQRDLEDERRMI